MDAEHVTVTKGIRNLKKLSLGRLVNEGAWGPLRRWIILKRIKRYRLPGCERDWYNSR
jgi:hypothetical protein